MANRRIKEIRTYYRIPEDASIQVRWILNLMNEYDLNQIELADKIHVTKQTVSLWLRDQTKISFGNICAIALYVDKNCDPERIWYMLNNPQQEQG